jgi:hypothetical protein
MTGWATVARERVDLLQDELDELAADGQRTDDLRERLEHARRTHLDGQHVWDWLTGDAVSETWSHLHRIEERVDERTPELEVVVRDAERHVRKELATDRAEAIVGELATATAAQARRTVAVDAIREAHLAAEARHDSERNQRRGVVVMGGGLLVGAAVLLGLQLWALDDGVVPAPDGAAVSAWTLLALVMLFGMLGGALSALVSLYITDDRFPNTLWFDPRPPLVLVKVVLGLWAAVIGVLAVSTGALVGTYTSVGAALLLALTFGYGQQAVTTFLDRKVAGIVEAPKP